MDRNKFLKNSLGAILSAATISEIAAMPEVKILNDRALINKEGLTPIAIDLDAIDWGGEKCPPKKVLDIFLNQKILLWRKPPNSKKGYSPIIIMK